MDGHSIDQPVEMVNRSMDVLLAESPTEIDLRGGYRLVRYSVHLQLLKAAGSLGLELPRCKNLGTRLDPLREVYPTGITVMPASRSVNDWSVSENKRFEI